MVHHIEAENNSHDLSPFSTTDEHNYISSNVYEYFNAVETGHVPVIPISNSVFISSMRNVNGETLLIAAARCGNASAVEALVKDNDIEETDNDGWSALLNASHHGHAEVVRFLLEAGAAVDQHDLMGWTSLMWACYKNRLQASVLRRQFLQEPHVNTVEELLNRKAHVNIAGEEDSLTPLIIASGRGYLEIVRRLVEAGAQINSSDKFGSTALIWAARKGHLEIVDELLNAGADLDAIGMHASTALMLATRGNHIKVVDALIARDPNVNIVDYNGLSALGIAAREGYTEIAQTLIQSGAYVNTIDRFGNSILASAVRSGSIHLVRMLLEKHADVNAKDSENRTPLHLAIDKAYGEIVLALLEKRPNLELRNKDGETALLRAVKNRDVALCQILVSVGAKLSATDNAGDNALHLALRARSRRMAQVLLLNPSDSKLLYRPNKLGETPYSIDQEVCDQPILPTIFGPIGNTDFELKNLLGYDAYGDVLADVVCEPNLSLPLTIGLYAKWGSGKSLLLPKIRESMKSFSRSWLEGMELYWSWTLVVILFVFCAFLSLCFAAILGLFSQLSWVAPLVFGVSLYATLFSAYGFVYYGSEIRLWNGSITTARFLARALAHFKVLLSVLTLRAPMRTNKELVVSPVSFLFADDHRLSFVGAGEQALTNIVQSLFISAEEHYGALAVRLFTAFNMTTVHPQHSAQRQPHGSKFQTLCGIPTILYIVLMFVSLTLSLGLYLKHPRPDVFDERANGSSSFIIASIVFLVIFAISSLAPLYLLCVRLSLNLPKRRIARIAHRTHLLSFERVIQKLQREVDLLVALIGALDAFTNSQTRMVIMVDGLDSCEQNKMVQMLDALTLFFGSRQNAPFIVVLAVDPHIIISAIQQNLLRGVIGGGGGASGSSTGIPNTISGTGNDITGYDYMRNVVTMPFFLDRGTYNRFTASGPAKRRFRNTSFRERKRSETTVRGSRLSLRDIGERSAMKDASGSMLAGANSSLVLTGANTTEKGNLFPSFDYFSNMNPRTMHRIVNSIALTGRLMRSVDVEFSWFILYTWVSLVEQWPYRMCWLIESCCGDEEGGDDFDTNVDASMTLSELYLKVKDEICVNCTLAADMDRNIPEFEVLLLRKVTHGNNAKSRSTNANSSYVNNSSTLGNSAKQQQNQKLEQQSQLQNAQSQEQLTVGHVRVFAGCTSNLDPYLRKQVRELRGTAHQNNKDLIDLKDGEAESDSEHLENVFGAVSPGSAAEFLFGEDSPAIWRSASAKPLARLTIDEVVGYLSKLNISTDLRLNSLTEKFYTNNLNGLVLQTCDLVELKDLLQAPLGDWTLIRLLVETLRKLKPVPPPPSSQANVEDSGKVNRSTAVNANSELDERRNNLGTAVTNSLLSIQEEIADLPATVVCPVSINLPDEAGSLQEHIVFKEDDGISRSSDSDSDSLKSVVGSRQNLVSSSPP